MSDQKNQYIKLILDLLSLKPALFFNKEAKNILLQKYADAGLSNQSIHYPSRQAQEFMVPLPILIDDFFKEYELIEFICTNENLENLPYSIIENLYRTLSTLNAMYSDNVQQNNPNIIEQHCIQLLSFLFNLKNIPPNILVSYSLNNLDYNEKGIANLQKISKDAKDALEHIQNIEKQSQNKLAVITQSTLTNKFINNASELKNSMNRWLITTYVSGGILFGFYIILFLILPFIPVDKDILNFTGNSISAIISKTILTFPIIYLFVFASRTYSIQKRLYEEYTFKVVMASSLESYLEIVAKVEKGNTDAKYRDFLVTSIDKIFTSPNKLAFNHKTDKDDGEMNMSELQTLVRLIKDVDKTQK